MDEKKIAFITCVNDDDMYQESMLYLQHLKMPKGMSAEYIPIRGAKSMTAGYEQGRIQTDAKYKIYLHQDVLVLKKELLEKLLECFQNPQVGMVGLAGCVHLPESGEWWMGEGCVSKVAQSIRAEQVSYPGSDCPETEVEAIDGVFMATQYDLPWRQDLFQGWHFYDISQSVEFRKAGYVVKVIAQEEPWLIHCTPLKHLDADYNYWRKIFIEKYKRNR